jgi:hypothetical protein
LSCWTGAMRMWCWTGCARCCSASSECALCAAAACKPLPGGHQC